MHAWLLFRVSFTANPPGSPGGPPYRFRGILSFEFYYRIIKFRGSHTYRYAAAALHPPIGGDRPSAKGKPFKANSLVLYAKRDWQTAVSIRVGVVGGEGSLMMR